MDARGLAHSRSRLSALRRPLSVGDGPSHRRRPRSRRTGRGCARLRPGRPADVGRSERDRGDAGATSSEPDIFLISDACAMRGARRGNARDGEVELDVRFNFGCSRFASADRGSVASRSTPPSLRERGLCASSSGPLRTRTASGRPRGERERLRDRRGRSACRAGAWSCRAWCSGASCSRAWSCCGADAGGASPWPRPLRRCPPRRPRARRSP